MSNKISNETKKAVLNMFKDGESQSKIAEKCGISPRSVGRIINAEQDKDITDRFTINKSKNPTEKNYDGLLPCPFCGGNAKIRSEQLPPEHCDYDMSYFVECTVCHLMTASVKTGLREWYKDKDHKELSTTEAIDRVKRMWNNRFESSRKEAVKND